MRDWVMMFNAPGQGGPHDRKASGQPSPLNDTHRAAIAAVAESRPTPAIHDVVMLICANGFMISSRSPSPGKRKP